MMGIGSISGVIFSPLGSFLADPHSVCCAGEFELDVDASDHVEDTVGLYVYRHVFWV